MGGFLHSRRAGVVLSLNSACTLRGAAGPAFHPFTQGQIGCLGYQKACNAWVRKTAALYIQIPASCRPRFGAQMSIVSGSIPSGIPFRRCAEICHFGLPVLEICLFETCPLLSRFFSTKIETPFSSYRYDNASVFHQTEWVDVNTISITLMANVALFLLSLIYFWSSRRHHPGYFSSKRHFLPDQTPDDLPTSGFFRWML